MNRYAWSLALFSALWWAGCSSAPPPAPVPEARRQAVFIAETAAKITLAENWLAAEREWQRAVQQFTALNDRTNEAAAWHNLAQVQRELGKYDLARQGLGQASELNLELRQTNTWWRNQIALIQLEALTATNQIVETRLAQLQAQFAHLTDTGLRGDFLNETGLSNLRNQQYAEAATNFNQAAEYFVQNLDRAGLAAVSNNRAELWFAQSNYAAATREWQKALQLNEILADRQGIASALAGLGKTLIQENNELPLAEKYLRRAAVGFRMAKQPAAEADMLSQLVGLLERQNKPAQTDQFALATAQMAHAAWWEAAGNPAQARLIWEKCARLWGQLGQLQKQQQALAGVQRCSPP